MTQESSAIAKTTARCALVPWKLSRVPEYAHGYTFLHI